MFECTGDFFLLGAHNKEIDFLDLAIEAKGIKIQKEKVVGVLKWPRPKTVKEVQKFLGLVNYYR